jgi:hypothetical protein
VLIGVDGFSWMTRLAAASMDGSGTTTGVPMSADRMRDPQRSGCEANLLPRDLDTVLVTPVHSYSDESGAVVAFSAPAQGGGPVQLPGRAETIVVLAVAVDGGPSDRGLDAIREEHDHPGVRIIPVDDPDWTVAYSVIIDAEASFAGGAVVRFVLVRGPAALSVTLSGIRGPLDHVEARSVARDILGAAGWADGTGHRAVGG